MTSGSDLDVNRGLAERKILSVEHDTLPSEYATVEVRGDEAFERDQSLVPISIYRTNTHVDDTGEEGGIVTIGVEEMPTSPNQQTNLRTG